MFCLFCHRKALKIQKEHREECQQLRQEHSPDPPERWELKLALLRAAVVPLTSVYLPGGE